MGASVEPEDVARELERLLDSPEFRRNRNASSFLKFVVEETLAGRGDRLKAFTIATLALQRDDSFDPQNNSIVRVQATRVRQMLESHYSGPGLDDPVRIFLPRGSYLPSFDRVETVGPLKPPGPSAADTRLRYSLLLAFACLLIGLVVGLSAETIMSRATLSAASVARGSGDSRLTPSIRVDVGSRLQNDPATEAFLGSLLASIRSGISAFDHVVVSQEANPGTDPDYRMTLSQLGHGEAGDDLAFNLVHRQSGSIIWTANFRGISLKDPSKPLQAITRSIVTEVGDVYGVLFSDWVSRGTVEGMPLTGIACQFAAFNYLKTRTLYDRLAPMNCLERDLVDRPDDPGIMSLMAIMLLRDFCDALPNSHGAADLQRALQLARRAYDRAPYRARTQFVLGLARFYDQRYEDAFGAMEQALASNPYSTLIRMNLGAAFVAQGRYEKGLDLLASSPTQDSGAPGHFASYIALASYMTDDSAGFERWSMRQATLGTPLGILMRLVALHRRGDRTAIMEVWNQLQSNYAAFSADVPLALARNGLRPDIIERLSNDIALIRGEIEPRP